MRYKDRHKGNAWKILSEDITDKDLELTFKKFFSTDRTTDEHLERLGCLNAEDVNCLMGKVTRSLDRTERLTNERDLRDREVDPPLNRDEV